MKALSILFWIIFLFSFVIQNGVPWSSVCWTTLRFVILWRHWFVFFCCPFFRSSFTVTELAFTNDNEPLNSVVDKKTLKMCFSCFKKVEVFFKWDKSTVDENFFKNRQFLAKTDIQRDIWIKYINRSSVLAAHYNTQYIYVSVYILEFSSKSAHKCSFLISLKCRACWPVIPSKNTLYVHVRILRM